MQRRNRPEQMDDPEVHAGELPGDLRNLEHLNRLFGGREVVRRRAGALLAAFTGEGPVRVLDVGSGAGDLCCELVRVARDQKIAVALVSVDFHAAVQAYARTRLGAGYPEVRFALSDARCLGFRGGQFDLVLCTLALHHFSEEDAVAVLMELRRVSRRWVLVSDLARSPAAYAAVWLATRFTRNRMTRFDGPVSVQRAFTPAELANLARRAGWTGPKLLREPWFRMSALLTVEGP